MKLLLPYLFLIFVNLIINKVYPQDTSKNWNIGECIQYATDHNIQINTLRLNELSAKQNLFAARGNRIPSLSATVGNTFNNANNHATGDNHLVNQLTSTGIYSLNSSIVLWNDNYIKNNIQQQSLYLQSAGLSVEQSENNITLLITQAYLDILLAKENEKYVADLVNTTDSSVVQGQIFYDKGAIAKKDLLQLKAQLASDKYLLVQTKNAIRQNILSLKQLLQLPAELPFDILTPASVDVPAFIPTLNEVKEKALQNFPEIKIGRLGMNIAALEITKAKALFKPQLRVSGAFGTGYSDVITNNFAPKTNYFTQTGNNFYQAVDLTLSIPVFSNRINKVNLEKSKIAYNQANLNYQDAQLVLSQAVEQSYLNTVNAHQAYDAAYQQLLYATESYRIVNAQLKLGAINTYDLLQQRNQYVQAVQAFTQAKYTAVLQQKIFEFYMGQPVTL